MEYTVGKEKGCNRYYVCRVGSNTPLTQRFSSKKKALHAAADMEGLNYREYLKLRKKGGTDND